MHRAPTCIHRDKIKNHCDNCFLFVCFICYVIHDNEIKYINKLMSILFEHLVSIILKNFKYHTLIITEIFEFIELHTYKFGLVYIFKKKCTIPAFLSKNVGAGKVVRN